MEQTFIKTEGLDDVIPQTVETELSPADKKINELTAEINELESKNKAHSLSHLIDLKAEQVETIKKIKKLESVSASLVKPEEEGEDKDAYVKAKVSNSYEKLALEKYIQDLQNHIDAEKLNLESLENTNWGETAPRLMTFKEAVEWAESLSVNGVMYKIPTIEELTEAHTSKIAGFSSENLYLSSTESTNDLKIEDRNHWAFNFKTGQKDSIGKAFPVAIRVTKK